MLTAVVATAQDKFKSLIGERVAPWLKDRGFRRKDATFRRQRDGAWQIVGFQRSRYSDAGDVPVAVNLGTALPLLHADPEPSWAARGWPRDCECDFRERLGMLMKGTDHWWRVRPLVPLSLTANAIIGGLEEIGMPWLELHSDPHRLVADAVSDLSFRAMNLHALVLVANEVGTAAEREAAASELGAHSHGWA